MDRNSERLLEQTIREVNAEFEMMQRKYPTVHYWQPGGMEVTFCNEPGEGAGVRRSFFTAIAEVNEGGNSSVYVHVSCTYVCVLHSSEDNLLCCRLSCPRRVKCLTSLTPLKGGHHTLQMHADEALSHEWVWYFVLTVTVMCAVIVVM